MQAGIGEAGGLAAGWREAGFGSSVEEQGCTGAENGDAAAVQGLPPPLLGGIGGAWMVGASGPASGCRSDGLQQRVEAVGLAPELPALAAAQFELQRTAIAGAVRCRVSMRRCGRLRRADGGTSRLERLEAAAPGIEIELLGRFAQQASSTSLRVLGSAPRRIRRTRPKRLRRGRVDGRSDRSPEPWRAGARGTYRARHLHPTNHTLLTARRPAPRGLGCAGGVQHDLRLVHGARHRGRPRRQEVLHRPPGHVVERVRVTAVGRCRRRYQRVGVRRLEAAEVGEDAVEVRQPLGALGRVQLLIRKRLQRRSRVKSAG